MLDERYAFAIGSVRVREGALLSKEDTYRLASARDAGEILRRIAENGYAAEDGDPMSALEAREREVWTYLCAILPDEHEFDCILIRSDFHNLKVILKATVAGKSAEGLFLRPSVYDPELLKNAVEGGRPDLLPEEMIPVQKQAYDVLVKTGFAQLADSILDRAALETAIALAKKTGQPTLQRLTQTQAAVTDIRVLWRCIAAGKARSFMESAYCPCEELDTEQILTAADEGREAFLAFLLKTPYADLAKALRETPERFEVLCDEKIGAALENGKADAFGVAPLVRYYYAVLNEIRNLRILISGKKNGLPEQQIRERMRFGYA